MCEPANYNTSVSENPPHRAGFVALAGRPNAGKSTLINRLLGQKVAAVSFRPQTTRRQQLGILTLEHAQIIFIDTPGLHAAKHRLGEWLNAEALRALEECDLALLIFDISRPPEEADRLLAKTLQEHFKGQKVVAAFNKLDALAPQELEERVAQFETLLVEADLPQADRVPISAARGDQLDVLIQTLVESLPDSPPYFPSDQLTDLFERDLAADLIREAALFHLRDEVPHAMAVRVDEYKERQETGAYLAATLFVERESQKGIVIGKGGAMLKEIGASARREIETLTGRKVYLELRVKVRPNWRNDEEMLGRMGFQRNP